MKTKTYVSIILLSIGMIMNGQNKNSKPLEGSWMGKISTKDFSLQALMQFEFKKNTIKGFLDLPESRIKDIGLDKVWMVKDSVFVDAKNALRWESDAPLLFKGRLMPGDSILEGFWSGQYPIKLSKTNYVFTLKTNSNPQMAGYKIIKLIDSTPFKDQQATGDCWSFATTSFIETEAIRLGKKPVVLSPMFFVRPTYINKAENYIRKNGTSFFSEGDLTFSVLKAYKEFGAIPEIVYSGK